VAKAPDLLSEKKKKRTGTETEKLFAKIHVYSRFGTFKIKQTCLRSRLRLAVKRMIVSSFVFFVSFVVLSWFFRGSLRFSETHLEYNFSFFLCVAASWRETLFLFQHERT